MRCEVRPRPCKLLDTRGGEGEMVLPIRFI